MIEPKGLAWAALALFFSSGISFLLDLGIARSILLAALRAFFQLILVGLTLSWIFEKNSFALSLSAIVLMTAIATAAFLGRTSEIRYRGITINTFISFAISTWLCSFFAGTFVLSENFWKQPSVLLPFTGLLLGNSLSGISLGWSQWTKTLDHQKEWIETSLALGATRWEAFKPAIRDALSTSMTPILNSMTVSGIVSMPGMMTGQLLAGADPAHSIRYQIAALFLVTASTFIGSLVTLLMGYRTATTSFHQIKWEPVRKPLSKKNRALRKNKR